MTCCYLCKSSFECSLKQGGVFVPLQEHFEKYCLTDYFLNCNHFKQFAASCAISPPAPFMNRGSTPLGRERRFFARQKAQFPVNLSSYETEETNEDSYDPNTLAQTIDFSQGGMRVRAVKPVAKQGLLLFNFGEGFIAPLLHGLAAVSWQKTYLDNGHWEAGLSFTDQFVKAVIAVQLSS